MTTLLPGAYVTLDNLRQYLGLNGTGAVTTPNGDFDTELTDAINAGSREVDNYTGRRFYQENSGADLTRVYYPEQRQSVLWTDPYLSQRGNQMLIQRVCEIDDCWSITSVSTDDSDSGTYSTVWTASTDYLTLPLNGVVGGITGHPVTSLYARGSKLFRVTGFGPSVQVVGKFGWAAVPEPVRQATLRVSAWLFKSREAPQGVVGLMDFGGIRLPKDEFSFCEHALEDYCTGSAVATIA